MNRKEFVIKCASCVGLASLISSCIGTKYFDAVIEESELVVPLSAFSDNSNGKVKERKYVLAQNSRLEYPICVYRIPNDEYSALWMQCTHQGTELQAFGDRLQCPAHGSEFTNRGQVQNGPADKNLRSFPVRLAGDTIRVILS